VEEEVFIPVARSPRCLRIGRQLINAFTNIVKPGPFVEAGIELSEAVEVPRIRLTRGQMTKPKT